MFSILAVLVDLSVGSMLLPVTASAWQKYRYLQIEWVELIFLLACEKQQGMFSKHCATTEMNSTLTKAAPYAQSGFLLLIPSSKDERFHIPDSLTKSATVTLST